MNRKRLLPAIVEAKRLEVPNENNILEYIYNRYSKKYILARRENAVDILYNKEFIVSFSLLEEKGEIPVLEIYHEYEIEKQVQITSNILLEFAKIDKFVHIIHSLCEERQKKHKKIMDFLLARDLPAQTEHTHSDYRYFKSIDVYKDDFNSIEIELNIKDKNLQYMAAFTDSYLTDYSIDNFLMKLESYIEEPITESKSVFYMDKIDADSIYHFVQSIDPALYTICESSNSDRFIVDICKDFPKFTFKYHKICRLEYFKDRQKLFLRPIFTNDNLNGHGSVDSIIIPSKNNDPVRISIKLKKYLIPMIEMTDTIINDLGLLVEYASKFEEEEIFKFNNRFFIGTETSIHFIGPIINKDGELNYVVYYKGNQQLSSRKFKTFKALFKYVKQLYSDND